MHACILERNKKTKLTAQTIWLGELFALFLFLLSFNINKIEIVLKWQQKVLGTIF